MLASLKGTVFCFNFRFELLITLSNGAMMSHAAWCQFRCPRMNYCPGFPYHMGWTEKRNRHGDRVTGRKSAHCALGKKCLTQTRSSWKCLQCQRVYCTTPPPPTKKNGFKVPKATAHMTRPGADDGESKFPSTVEFAESCFQIAHREGMALAMRDVNVRVHRALQKDGHQDVCSPSSIHFAACPTPRTLAGRGPHVHAARRARRGLAMEPTAEVEEEEEE